MLPAALRASPHRLRPAAPAPRPGFALVEVVVAILLLTTGVLATLSVHVSVTHLSARAAERYRLAVEAANVLDSLRGIPCGSVVAGSAGSTNGRLAWTTRADPATTTVSLAATPVAGAAWHAETILPCP